MIDYEFYENDGEIDEEELEDILNEYSGFFSMEYVFDDYDTVDCIFERNGDIYFQYNENAKRFGCDYELYIENVECISDKCKSYRNIFALNERYMTKYNIGDKGTKILAVRIDKNTSHLEIVAEVKKYMVNEIQELLEEILDNQEMMRSVRFENNSICTISGGNENEFVPMFRFDFCREELSFIVKRNCMNGNPIPFKYARVLYSYYNLSTKIFDEFVEKIKEQCEINKLSYYEKSMLLKCVEKKPTDKFDEVKKYKELLDMNIISEEEFIRKRNELLSL